MKYDKQIKESLALLQRLSGELQKACNGKLSTNDITPNRLLWEIFNKIFSILVICENCLIAKDSLTIHLVARYTYEMLIVFAYIFQGKSVADKKKEAEQFIRFNQFTNNKRKWTDKTLAEMIKSIPNSQRFTTHSNHYRNLSNFAHPSMDSFMLNRKGKDYEISMILGTTLLTIGTILEIIKICFEENLYFDDQHKNMLNFEAISSNMGRLMKELQAILIKDIQPNN